MYMLNYQVHSSCKASWWGDLGHVSSIRNMGNFFGCVEHWGLWTVVTSVGTLSALGSVVGPWARGILLGVCGTVMAGIVSTIPCVACVTVHGAADTADGDAAGSSRVIMTCSSV